LKTTIRNKNQFERYNPKFVNFDGNFQNIKKKMKTNVTSKNLKS
jgi:hypothetical protein